MLVRAAWVVVATLPAAFVLSWGAAALQDLADPCYHWGLPPGPVSPNEGGCNGYRGTSESRNHAITRLTLVHGLILLACALAGLGIMHRSALPLGLGVVILFAECFALVFGGAFVFPLLSAWLFFAGYYFTAEPRATTGTPGS